MINLSGKNNEVQAQMTEKTQPRIIQISTNFTNKRIPQRLSGIVFAQYVVEHNVTLNF